MASSAHPQSGACAGSGAEILWRHPDPTSTHAWAFLEHVNSRYSLQLRGYADMYRWSVEDVSAFWGEVWDFVGIIASVPYETVLPSMAMYPRPDFMRHARLNFAQNLLFPPTTSRFSAPAPDSPALISVTEVPGSTPAFTSWASLRDSVRRCSCAMRSAGVRLDDVVAGLVANHEQALVAMLAAAALGAVWTALSPDTGSSAVLDRYLQIKPKVLFADDGAIYNGKSWNGGDKVKEVASRLVPLGLKVVVMIGILNGEEGLGLSGLVGVGVEAVDYIDFLQRTPDSMPLLFEQLPPSHPVYILYSSGTTGLPKAIVHTALGTLIQHKKEHALHCSLSCASRMLYFTTTSWMMWHWSVSALAVGTTLVLYSGSPFKPHGHLTLPRLLSDLRVTHFGTSAAYLCALETNRVFPSHADASIDLSSLQAIYSTASPLPPSTFRYVYDAFPTHVNLASITGGTDIISLFGAPCPLLPVRVGEIQCAGLGMAVRAVDSATGAEVPAGQPGDLVCVAPFPSQPLTFWGPGGDAKYRAAYFERFSDVAGGNGPVWHHGDFVKIPDAATGGLVMLGRSDGVLKPSGVRFGSAEIYNMLTKFFGSVVDDAVCVGRRREQDRDETVCLFLSMADGHRLDGQLRDKIKATIRTELSPRHVPGVIDVCAAGIPRTANGKKVEVAVKQVISGIDVTTNASVANPEALDWFREWATSN